MKSLIFTAASSQFLNRTYGTATNTKIFSISYWAKRTSIGQQTTFSTASGINTLSGFGQNSTTANAFSISDATPSFTVAGNTAITDTTNWHHYLIGVDTTQATAANRIRLYVDAAEVTYGNTTYPAQNADILLNDAVVQRIGQYGGGGAFLDGKLADVFFVDGTILTPSSFVTGSGSGTTFPKFYDTATSGITFGTNGFRLTFANATSTTTLGQDDASGSPGGHSGTNDWTLNAMTTGNSSTDAPTAPPVNAIFMNPRKRAYLRR